MKILEYTYKGTGSEKWHISKMALESLNLVVGDCGSGKTRFLNTLFNLGLNVTGRRKNLLHGQWTTRLQVQGQTYEWRLKIDPSPTGGPIVTRERLVDEESPDSTPIVDRSGKRFIFQGAELPKLSRERTSLELLQEEDIINPLYEGFCNMMRRDFSKAGLREYILYEVIPHNLLEHDIQDMQELFRLNLGLNSRLHLLKRNFLATYQRICTRYLELFPFVEEIALRDAKNIGLQIDADALGPSPVFSIKEKDVSEWIPVPELASGMQKVLLILTDLYSLPDGAIYLVDEYENSLGVSVIDFVPECLDELEKDLQVILTSHHPYVINQVPIQNWIVFHREGTIVRARYGESNVEHYGRSKQQRFVQLLNDPFYNRSIE